MTTYIGAVTRPAAGTGARARSLRKIGLVLGAMGLGIATIGFLASINAGRVAGSEAAADQLATSLILAFGLATAGFASLKFGIGIILVGIVRRIWTRVDATRVALPALVQGRVQGQDFIGEYESPHGPATATREAPAVLPIHRVAQLMWAPMLAMGAMAVMIGLLVDFVAAANTGAAGAASSEFAWAQGLLFLGETFLLAGISFLLATILAAIRAGGGEVQQSMGLTVKTLQMPTSAKAFIGLMIAGVMIGIIQFIGYVAISSSSNPADIAAAFAWLGPLREFALGVLLAGIVLALATIAKALDFQFSRITEIITSGR
ncbi:MAG: hypothetical protein ACC726_17240 [Chloroflexota bacterium]